MNKAEQLLFCLEFRKKHPKVLKTPDYKELISEAKEIYPQHTFDKK